MRGDLSGYSEGRVMDECGSTEVTRGSVGNGKHLGFYSVCHGEPMESFEQRKDEHI